MTLVTHRVSHDLLVGFPIVAVRGIPGRPKDLCQRNLHRRASDAAAIEQGSVDVEQNEPHVRVRNTPATIVPAPTAWNAVGVSLRNARSEERRGGKDGR